MTCAVRCFAMKSSSLIKTCKCDSLVPSFRLILLSTNHPQLKTQSKPMCYWQRHRWPANRGRVTPPSSLWWWVRCLRLETLWAWMQSLSRSIRSVESTLALVSVPSNQFLWGFQGKHTFGNVFWSMTFSHRTQTLHPCVFMACSLVYLLHLWSNRKRRSYEAMAPSPP